MDGNSPPAPMAPDPLGAQEDGPSVLVEVTLPMIALVAPREAKCRWALRLSAGGLSRQSNPWRTDGCIGSAQELSLPRQRSRGREPNGLEPRFHTDSTSP